MYPLLESIKLKNGLFYLLPFHQERMNRASKSLYGKDCVLDISNCISELEIPKKGVFKCRLFYGKENFEIKWEPYFPKEIKSLKLIFDDTIEYPHKYADRTALSKLLNQKGKADEIIIVKNGFITDASYANLIFRDGKSWYTPKHPLLKGVQRKNLLKEGLIREAYIRPSDLCSFQEVALINALLDFKDKIIVPLINVFY